MAAATTKSIDLPSREHQGPQVASNMSRKDIIPQDAENGDRKTTTSSTPYGRNGDLKYMPALSPSTAAWLRGKAVAASAAAAARNKAAASMTAAAQEARKQKNVPMKPKPASQTKVVTTEADSIKRTRKSLTSKVERSTKRNTSAKSGPRPPRAKKGTTPATSSNTSSVPRRKSTDFTPSPGVSSATGVARKPSKAQTDDGSSTTSGSTTPKGKVSDVSSVISDRKPPAVKTTKPGNDNRANAITKPRSKEKLIEDDPALDGENKITPPTKKKKKIKLLSPSDESTKKSKRKIIKQDSKTFGETKSVPSRTKLLSKDTEAIVKQKTGDIDKNRHRLRYASPVHGEKPRRSSVLQSMQVSSKSAFQKQRSQDQVDENGDDDESSSDDDVRATIPGAICIREDDDGESFDGSELTPSVYTLDTRQIPVAAELAPDAESMTEKEAVKRMVAIELQKERESQVIVEAIKVPERRRTGSTRVLSLPSLAEETREGSNKHPPHYYCVACTTICLLLAIIMGVLLGIALKKEDKVPLPTRLPIASNSTFPPTKPPSIAPPSSTSAPTKDTRLENIQHIVLQRYSVLLNPTDADKLQDPTTPQFAALNWMANDDKYVAARVNDLSGSEISERYALVVFFFSTVGQEWFDDFGFLNSLKPGPVCDWGYGSGILCDGKNSVTTLSLSTNGLSGNIPKELAFLSSLQELILEDNSIKGTLPKELSTLKMLKTISLLKNQISGTLPIEFGQLQSISSLHLENNMLSGRIPSEIGSMSSLVQLFLGNNGFASSLPTDIGRLTELDALDLLENEMTGSIPSEIGLLSSHLYQLNLGANKFSGTIPSEIGDLVLLQQLDLHDNLFTGWLPELDGLTDLTLLHLQHNNQITGTLPDSWGQLSALEELRLAGISLSGDLDSVVCRLYTVSYSSASCGDGFMICECCTECCNVISFEEEVCG